MCYCCAVCTDEQKDMLKKAQDSEKTHKAQLEDIQQKMQVKMMNDCCPHSHHTYIERGVWFLNQLHYDFLPLEATPSFCSTGAVLLVTQCFRKWA